MTIEKLKSGKYRIRQMVDGKRYNVTVDHKPTVKEANKLLADIAKKPTGKKTLQEAAEAYIESRRNIISPATVRGYMKLVRGIPDRFRGVCIYDMASGDLQALVNEYTPDHSPKTVKNMACFIMAVLKENDILLRSPTLPKPKKKADYIPTSEDVRRILKYFEGTEFEVGVFLSCLGLRRSELAALTVDDLNGNVLTINKAMVQNEEGEYVVKETKTTASTRSIVIPDRIADLIRSQGYVYRLYISRLYYALHKAQEELGIPKFTAHKLRHFFCSYAHDLGYSDAQIAEMGGWVDNSRIMKLTYRHAMEIEEAKRCMAADIAGLSE